ncbi:DUF3667 domain-containing protein [Actomonas aquatica]|uniref:DUF3667 domain-containing protein n=1 Tax=Actomonas aquatica TaxID=2866162 RepID=A0ABZ1C2D0_9BACT|nr:DUF3667 domain-containing protein [Opitutus sp. WL0086]WRQ85856.1 DUF3667 domain-containing protein [Opitutus sp. WL0086]
MATEPPAPGSCLNCGTPLTDRFCPHCGQKAQPTRLPLRDVLGEATSTFLNVDGLFWRTLRTLFLHPGQVTADYNAGRRAAQLPPLRIYLGISVIYFVTLSFLGQDRVLFVSLTTTKESGAAAEIIGPAMQYLLFFFVPALAGLLKLLRCRPGGYFVEYLVFAIHLHSIWFAWFWLQLVLGGLLDLAPASLSGITRMLGYGVDAIPQALPVIYLILSLRRAFELRWWTAIWKSFAAILGYSFLLAVAMAVFFAFSGI